MTRALAPCGTVSAYNRHLRYREAPCASCNSANNAYHRHANRERAKNVPARVHGSTNGYVNYLCRCRSCKAAWSAAMRVQYQRSKSAPGSEATARVSEPGAHVEHE